MAGCLKKKRVENIVNKHGQSLCLCLSVRENGKWSQFTVNSSVGQGNRSCNALCPLSEDPILQKKKKNLL